MKTPPTFRQAVRGISDELFARGCTIHRADVEDMVRRHFQPVIGNLRVKIDARRLNLMQLQRSHKASKVDWRTTVMERQNRELERQQAVAERQRKLDLLEPATPQPSPGRSAS